MGLFSRLHDVVLEKANRGLDAAERPDEAIDLAYQQQLESLQKVRRSLVEMLTSEKQLESQQAQLKASATTLDADANTALAHSNEDLARQALQRKAVALQQATELTQQLDTLKTQEKKLEDMEHDLQNRVEQFRMQKEAMKAQYQAAVAANSIQETVSGVSQKFGDTALMIDRAKEKTSRLEARSAAIGQLMDNGTLNDLNAAPNADLQSQINALDATDSIDAQLEAKKQALADTTPLIIRIHGGSTYSLTSSSKATVDEFDDKLTAAIHNEAHTTFTTVLHKLVKFVQSNGVRVADDIEASIIIPDDAMTLADALELLKSEVHA